MKRRGRKAVNQVLSLIYNGGCNEWTVAEVADLLKRSPIDLEQVSCLIYNGGCNEWTATEAMELIRKEVKI